AVAGCDVGHAHAVALRGVTGTETAARTPEGSGERRQAGDGASSLPAVRALVHGGAADEDHAPLRSGVAAHQRTNGRRRDARLGLRPLRGVSPSVVPQLSEPRRVRLDEPGVAEILGDEDVDQRQGEGRVRARTDEVSLVRVLERLTTPDIDGDDPYSPL